MGEANFYYFTCLKLSLTIAVASQDEFYRFYRVSRGLRVSKRGLDSNHGTLYRLLESDRSRDGSLNVARWPDVGGQSLYPGPVILFVLQTIQRRHFWRASTMSSGQTVRSERHETVGQDLRASECQMKKCPDWIQKMASMKSSTEVVDRITHGSHGCIDCVIGECHQCLCRDALKWSFNGVATVVDPNNKAGNQYLVCEGSRITCHACPKGLVWNCRLGVCARTSECPPTPAKCQ